MNRTAQFPIALDLAEGRIEAQIELSLEAERLVDLTIKMLGLSSAVADMGARAAQRLGLQVSCGVGCGHCCRQLVPLSAPEAAMVCEFVETLPEPRRQEIASRFSAAVSHLKTAGLLSELEDLHDPRLTDHELTAITRKYFAQQIACPFLENESCSIYEARPSMCREYLVCSPAGHCRDPYGLSIVKLPVSMRLSQALSHLWAGLTKSPPVLVPFVLALRWTAGHAHCRTFAANGELLLQALLKRIAETAAAMEP